MNTQLRSTNASLPFPYTSRPITTPSITQVEERAFEVQYIQNLSLVTVKGWSINNDIESKYSQLLMDVEKHLNAHNTLMMHFKYDHFNSTSAKYLFKIIKLMNKAYNEGKEVNVNWSYALENMEEMVELGQDISEMCDFDFEITHA